MVKLADPTSKIDPLKKTFIKIISKANELIEQGSNSVTELSEARVNLGFINEQIETALGDVKDSHLKILEQLGENQNSINKKIIKLAEKEISLYKMQEQQEEALLPPRKTNKVSDIKKQFSDLLSDIQNLPKKADQIKILAAFEEQSGQLKEEIDSPVPPLPEPDPSGKSYPLYKAALEKDPDLHPYKFLKNSDWAQYLPHFGNKALKGVPYLFQDQLDKLDPLLGSTLKSRRVGIESMTGEMFNEIIPPKSVRRTYEIEKIRRKKQKAQETQKVVWVAQKRGSTIF